MEMVVRVCVYVHMCSPYTCYSALEKGSNAANFGSWFSPPSFSVMAVHYWWYSGEYSCPSPAALICIPA